MRPRFFSKYEWWYHLVMMPALFVVGNYYFIGNSYFEEFSLFWRGTVLIFFLYWFSVVILTIVIRHIIRRYPESQQTKPRLLVMLCLVGLLTLGLAIIDVAAYHVTPGLNIPFSWRTVRQIWILGGIFDVFLCIVLGLFYSFEQWKVNQTETEQLSRMALQLEFDKLKGEINPHFLFNSLNTLSSLIGDDPEKAELFVENLSRVYRYMLQAGKTQFVPLEAELNFLKTYASLLQIRYGNSLFITYPEHQSYANYYVAPLSFQLLVDDAIKHNIMKESKPLRISITVSLLEERIRIQHTLQPKMRVSEMDREGLSTVVTKYQLLSDTPVGSREEHPFFTVTLPLFSSSIPV